MIRNRPLGVLFISLVLLSLAACSASVGVSQVDVVRPAVPSGLAGAPERVAAWSVSATPTPLKLADDGEERRFMQLFEQINPSVVHVHAETDAGAQREAEGRRAMQAHEFAGFRGWASDPYGGSGFVLDEDGHILTTNRLVADAEEIEITFADGSTTAATRIGADPNTDLAVLKVERSPATAQPLEFADSDDLRVGQRVAALSNPLGHGGSMTVGIVSAKARNVRLEIRIDNGFFTAPDLIQTDAALTAGMVGGPLVDLSGRVVGVAGVDTLLFDTAGSMRAGGVGFSIPTSTVQRVVPVLLEEGRYAYPWLGISGMDLDPDLAQAMDLPSDQRGVLVVRVTEESPAGKAGLRGSDQEVPELGPNVFVGGDVIVGFEGQPVRNFDELVSLLFREGEVGETVTLTVLRDGERVKLPLTLEERP